MEDGTRVRGETKITASKGRIKELFLIPPDVEPLPQTLDAIARADLITIGPGSLFTSLIPNLLVNGIAKAIVSSSASKVYVCNLMTQANESLGRTAADHIRALNGHAQARIFDYALLNRASISAQLKAKYALEGAAQVVVDHEAIKELGVSPVLGDYLDEGEVARHATDRIARDLMELAAQARSNERSVRSTRPRAAYCPLISTRRILTSPVPTRCLIFGCAHLRGILDRMPKAKNHSPHVPRVAIAIMAAGKGTRLKSKHPKVLHEVGGKPLLAHVIAAATKVVPAQDVFAIIGHEADRVREAVADTGINFVLQAEQQAPATL